MINLKKIIKIGFEIREKGFEMIGSTIQKAAESVGLGIDDDSVIRELPKDIGNNPAFNKDFLAAFEKENPTAKNARIIVNGGKKWINTYQFDRLIERGLMGVAVYEEDGKPFGEYITFSQNYLSNGWSKTIVKISHSKKPIDPTIL